MDWSWICGGCCCWLVHEYLLCGHIGIIQGSGDCGSDSCFLTNYNSMLEVFIISCNHLVCLLVIYHNRCFGGKLTNYSCSITFLTGNYDFFSDTSRFLNFCTSARIVKGYRTSSAVNQGPRCGCSISLDCRSLNCVQGLTGLGDCGSNVGVNRGHYQCSGIRNRIERRCVSTCGIFDSTGYFRSRSDLVGSWHAEC